MTITAPPRFIIFLIALGLAGGAWRLAWGQGTLLRAGEFVVAPGSSAQTIWEELQQQGYSDRTWPWRYHAWRLQATESLQAGTYVLTRGETVVAVVARLQAGETVPDELAITYPEGFTLRQVAERTAARKIGTVDDFLAAARPAAYVTDFPFLAALPDGRTLEGYLFPDTYRVFIGDAPERVIRRMLATFADKFSDELRQGAASARRTVDEIVIMASMIEREVTSDEDMAVVAGILWRRLDDGVGLDADATIRYALDRWEGPLTADDLLVDSPYNTRRYRGLPPGPISNPGLRALMAAVRPQPSDYYYYLSAPDGQTVFSKTLGEHNANKATHLP